MSAIRSSQFERPSKINARSSFVVYRIEKYSDCGYNCVVINAEIGRFTSIGNKVVIRVANHPLKWLSISSAFYYGRDSILKNLAKLSYDPNPMETKIESDVWRGRNVLVKGGVVIGDGDCVGMVAVVI